MAKVWFLFTLITGSLSVYCYRHPDFLALPTLSASGPTTGPATSPTQASPLSPTPVVPTPVPAPVEPPPRQISTDLHEFFIIKNGADDGIYEAQLDAKEGWRRLSSVSDGDVINFSATGLVCGGKTIGCAGPNGQDNLARTALTAPEEFPVLDAYCQALVGKVAEHLFQVGEQKSYVVPDGTGSAMLELTSNFRWPYLRFATGGFRVVVKIERKALR